MWNGKSENGKVLLISECWRNQERILASEEENNGERVQTHVWVQWNQEKVSAFFAAFLFEKFR